MTNKARELLERAYQYIPMSSVTSQEIRTYLAESEVKREALSIEEAHSYYSESHYDKTGWVFFHRGVRFAEKHHGISGGGDE